MTGSAKADCKDQAGHHLHLCQLKKRGLGEAVSDRTDQPGYICHNCGAVANHAKDLCNSSPIIRRP
jgi:hypothetical protein